MTSDWLSVCETGECLEIQIQGDTVVLRETSTPDVEVVTPLASWQAWQDKARAEGAAQERAAIVEWLREHVHAVAARCDDPAEAHYAVLVVADRIERGGFADVAANHD